ncbi:MAG: hypothetical protein IPG87_08850 [Saprospiraceae bacterium]|nr:hypothetical protein [Candidatus Vicinibacter affinis]
MDQRNLVIIDHFGGCIPQVRKCLDTSVLYELTDSNADNSEKETKVFDEDNFYQLRMAATPQHFISEIEQQRTSIFSEINGYISTSDPKLQDIPPEFLI